MNRPTRVLFASLSPALLALATVGCGTERLSVPTSTRTVHSGAVLFSERCGGCHTLSYAGTHGSASNVRTAMPNNGPNFNVRCERPITRVLYAIENGGFSGAIMPQNIVVGQDAREVAQFVSQYAGRQAPRIIGLTPCPSQQIGALPAPGQTATEAKKAAGPASKPRAPGTTKLPARPGIVNGRAKRKPARR